MSALNAQKAFLNNIKNVMNQRVDVRENNKQYQNTLSYASSKASCSIRLSMHMLPSNMNLNIMPRTVGFHNKILVSDSGLSLGKNNVVNAPEKSINETTIVHRHKNPLFRPRQNTPQASRMMMEKIALVLG